MTQVLEVVKAGVATGDAVQKIFELAKEGHYALPAVNCVNTDTVNSVLEAAAKAKAPVIVQFSNGGAAFFAGKGLKLEGQQSAILGAIAGGLREEHPQVVALVLSSLPPEQAASVVNLLPSPLRDDGSIRGVDPDYAVVDKGKANWDGFSLFLNNLLRMRLAIENPFLFYTVERRKAMDHDVCVVRVRPAPKPVYLDKHLFVRSGCQTIEMLGPDLVHYVATRWPD